MEKDSGKTDLFKCQKCGAEFKDMKSLQDHEKKHEQEEEKGKLEQGTQEPTEKPSLQPGGLPGPPMGMSKN